jgi:hypothetical protein
MAFHLHLSSARIAVPFAAVLALSLAAGAQTAPVRGQTVTPGGSTATHAHQEPCWQVAGISKSAMEQHRSIMQGVHSQVESVCADSSLTAQQKNAKIREIHQQAKQQVDAIISPQQMQSLKSCKSSRGTEHASTGGHMGGPCGQLPGSSGATTGKAQPENDLEN